MISSLLSAFGSGVFKLYFAADAKYVLAHRLLELSRGKHHRSQSAQRGGFASQDPAAQTANFQAGLPGLGHLLRLQASLRPCDQADRGKTRFLSQGHRKGVPRFIFIKQDGQLRLGRLRQGGGVAGQHRDPGNPSPAGLLRRRSRNFPPPVQLFFQGSFLRSGYAPGCGERDDFRSPQLRGLLNHMLQLVQFF